MSDDTCRDCPDPVEIKKHALCRRCYLQKWRRGELGESHPRGCSTLGCQNRHKGHGFCKKCLDREHAAGRLLDESTTCTFTGGHERPRPAVSDGLCLAHLRQKRAGKPLTRIQPRQSRSGQCPGPECTERIHAKGHCAGHYWQLTNGLELTVIVRDGTNLKGAVDLLVTYGQFDLDALRTVLAAHGDERERAAYLELSPLATAAA